MNDDSNPMLKRIRALLAKAESTPFPDEAATYTAKAHELMVVHAIDQALIEEQDGRGEIGAKRIVLPSPYARDKFRLLNAVATPNRCRAILGFDGSAFDEHQPGGAFHDDKNAEIATVLGYESDLDMVELLFTSLLVQSVTSMLRHGSVHDGYENRTRSFRHSFLVAFAHTVFERLTESSKTVTASADADASGSLLPVLLDRSKKVDDAVTATFPNLSTMRTSVSNGGGLQAGVTAGRQADIGTSRLRRGAPALDR